MKPTLEKYSLYPTTYYYWKRKYFVSGEQGLDHGNSKEAAGRIKELEKVLKHYKEMVAEKELVSRLRLSMTIKERAFTKKYKPKVIRIYCTI